MSVRDNSFVINLYDGLTSNLLESVNYHDFSTTDNMALVPMNLDQYKLWLVIQRKLINKEDVRLINGYSPVKGL